MKARTCITSCTPIHGATISYHQLSRISGTRLLLHGDLREIGLSRGQDEVDSALLSDIAAAQHSIWVLDYQIGPDPDNQSEPVNQGHFSFVSDA
jgi:hypothetical protein